MFRYYVSFSHTIPNGIGMAAVDVSRREPFSTVDDVTSVREELAQRGFRGITILAFSQYGLEKPALEARSNPGRDRR